MVGMDRVLKMRSCLVVENDDDSRHVFVMVVFLTPTDNSYVLVCAIGQYKAVFNDEKRILIRRTIL